MSFLLTTILNSGRGRRIATGEVSTPAAPSAGVFIGDSTIAEYPTGMGLHTVPYYVLQSMPADSTINMLAVPGDTIENQLYYWSQLADPTIYDWVIVQVGLNNCGLNISSSDLRDTYQNLIDTIRADAPDIVIVAGTMTPCKQRFIDTLGAIDGATALGRHTNLNSDILNAITGIDHTYSSHSAALSDGSGNLAAIYDTGDHIHTNNPGRQVNSGACVAVLTTAAFVTI